MVQGSKVRWCGAVWQVGVAQQGESAQRGGAVRGGTAMWGSAERCGEVGRGSATRGEGHGERMMQHDEVTVWGGDNVRGQFEGTKHSEVSSEAR